MKIVHVASEIHPFMKTGGLGDAVAGLARAQARRGHDVVLVLPAYRAVVERPELAHAERRHVLSIELGDVPRRGYLSATRLAPGLELVLVHRDEAFDRREAYGVGDADYDDNDARFIFFAKAAVQSLRLVAQKADVVHGHDWQAGLVPLFLRHAEQGSGENLALRTVLTIHNLVFPGLFPRRSFQLTNLPDELWSVEGVEFYGQLGMLKAGILFSDKIATVSPSHARAMLTPEHGCGLDGVLRVRADDIAGVLHGVDADLWNPAGDPALPAAFSADSLQGRIACTRALEERFGWRPGGGPLFVHAGRLTEQKGADLVADTIPFLVEQGARLVVLGRGSPAIEKRIVAAALAAPASVFHEPEPGDDLLHLAFAGGDFLLMPSRNEPGGLTQLNALRYGLVPVVACVGGLCDTVTDLAASPREGTGVFCEPTRDGVRAGVATGLRLAARPAELAACRARGMRREFTWDAAAEAYDAIYTDGL